MVRVADDTLGVVVVPSRLPACQKPGSPLFFLLLPLDEMNVNYRILFSLLSVVKEKRMTYNKVLNEFLVV